MSHYFNNGTRTPRGDAEHMRPPGSGERRQVGSKLMAKFADRQIYVLLGDELCLTTERDFLDDHAPENRRAWRFDVHGFLVEWDWREAYAEHQQDRADQTRHDAGTRRMQRP